MADEAEQGVETVTVPAVTEPAAVEPPATIVGETEDVMRVEDVKLLETDPQVYIRKTEYKPFRW